MHTFAQCTAQLSNNAQCTVQLSYKNNSRFLVLSEIYKEMHVRRTFFVQKKGVLQQLHAQKHYMNTDED